ncbi:helix-turn-helix domain-containing protein [Streptomyces sp. NPDC046976]|uniref:helix-turn-helix domain-containing protein n=1 Tax=Streptomyces sp. NPDC046976 TaxID=3155258 RepID=UPI0033E4BF3C
MEAQRALVRQVGDRVRESQEALVEGLVQDIRAQIGALDQEAAARSLLEASITENVVAAINFLRQGIDPDQLEAPTAALTYARVLAQRDVPQSALIRAYRIGHQRFLDHTFALLDDLPAADRVPVCVELVRLSGQFIDLICEQVGRTYERERDRWVASRSGVRQQWVTDLLGGGPVDRAAAERALRYPLDAVHLACTLWPAARMTSFDLVAAVDDVRAHAVSVLRARAALVVPTDEYEARLWLALPELPNACAAPSSSASAPGYLTAPEGSPLHAAFGRPGAGLGGFRTSARQAARIREILGTRLGSGAAAAPLWVHYDQAAPVALMAGDLPAVRDFVTSTLGALAAAGAREAVLRDTLRVFLDRHRGHAATARAMSLHRNSVQYRVHRATALLPRGERDLADDFNVRAALLAVHWLGDAVLATGP